MHSSSFDTEESTKDGGEVLVSIAALVTEGRIPGKLDSKSKKFYEGPHCNRNKPNPEEHTCDLTDSLCKKFKTNKEIVLNFWNKNQPLCIEVALNCDCKEEKESSDTDILLEKWYFKTNGNRTPGSLFFNAQQLTSAIRSQLYFSQIAAWLTTQDESTPCKIDRSNLTYRLGKPREVITASSSQFSLPPVKHEFPLTDLGSGDTLSVTFLSLPRMSSVPNFKCAQCLPQENAYEIYDIVDDRMHTSCTLKGKHRCEDLEEFESGAIEQKVINHKRLCQITKKPGNQIPANSEPSTSSQQNKLRIDIEKANTYEPDNHKHEKRNISPEEEKKSKSAKLESDLCRRGGGGGGVEGCQICSNGAVQWTMVQKNDLNPKNKGQLLLEAIERSGRKNDGPGDCCSSSPDDGTVKKDKVEERLKGDESDQQISANDCSASVGDNAKCDMSASDIFSIKGAKYFNIYVDKHCDIPIPRGRSAKPRDVSNVHASRALGRKIQAKQKITFDDYDPVNDEENKQNDKAKELNAAVDIPSPLEQAKFRKNLDNAANMVFHSRTGLPLTSSPAPVRRGKTCFDFDSTINSVSAIKSALFSSSFSTDEESESDGSIVSPCSPELFQSESRQQTVAPIKYRRKGHAANLLGSFEESVLNGRLEPVSTVHGFRAELGASGSFVPKHLIVPVTVFFYTLGDNDKVSTPYLGHINLGKKGYNVPKSGTVQVTLFNPLGTVVKMFVIMYDLTDMPPNSQTFIRQRTLYMPTNCKDENLEWGPKWLRYLIHLRFMSSKSGKIYLHSDIRMIIFRKSDMDTATAHGIDMSYELRSFTHMPSNPRFSPRK